MSGRSIDPVDTMLNMNEFENVSHYSPSALSPSGSQKGAFIARPSSQATTPIMPQMASQMSGPSHQYDLYKQQTGIVPGALASTLASVNVNPGMSGFTGSMNMDYLGGMPTDPLFNFNTAPSQALNPSELGMDFQSQTNEFFFDNALAPSVADSASIASQPIVPSQSGNIRYYPGMHKQAALMKEQQQRQRQQQQAAAATRPRSKSNQPSDPIVEQKITQLLNSMRAKTTTTDVDDQSSSLNLPKMKKEEEDMDEDERLLASEEGKKLSSKERRQLRNKVSARAFRSRRKEYISHLEAEISSKVSENGDLRAENRSLMEENKRLSDLTRMLLSSPSFSNFLDNLSANAMASEVQSQMAGQEMKQEHVAQQQPPKDVSQYAPSVHSQQLTMIPEQNVDFTMNPYEGSEPSLYNAQPQVYALTELPEMPASFTETLSGKQSNFVGSVEESDNNKIEIPSIESVAEKTMAPESPITRRVDAEFESNPDFTLFNSSEDEVTQDRDIDIFCGVEPEKMLARFELVDAEEEERNAIIAMARVERLNDILDARMEAIAHMMSD
ncbi:hypothetical protein BROUX41_005362 [Berkeleyomyces rouxiae]|uniref:uncharacterized protein n=1 Tax=Berkeleyomyces rouxiae TaxID=2035830 RepID=UPI003B7FFE05